MITLLNIGLTLISVSWVWQFYEMVKKGGGKKIQLPFIVLYAIGVFALAASDYLNGQGLSFQVLTFLSSILVLMAYFKPAGK